MLPAAIWGEKEGTYTNSERRVSKVNRAVDRRARRAPTSTSSSIWPPSSGAVTSFSRLDAPEDAFEEWKRVSAGRLCDYSGMTYEAIDANGGIQWPYPAGGASDVAPATTALQQRRVSDRRRQGPAHPDEVGTVP